MDRTKVFFLNHLKCETFCAGGGMKDTCFTPQGQIAWFINLRGKYFLLEGEAYARRLGDKVLK